MRNAKYICYILFSLGIYNQCLGQLLSGPATVNAYTLAKKRLLLVNTVSKLFQIDENGVDEDSLQLLACRLYHLPALTPYNDLLENANPNLNSGLIDEIQIRKDEQILQTPEGKMRPDLLVELSLWYLHRAGSAKGDLEKAGYFINRALKFLATRPFDNQKNAFHFLLGEWQYQSGFVSESSKTFQALADACAKQGDVKCLARSNLQMAKMLRPDDSTKLIYLQKALGLYQKSGDKEKEIEALWHLYNYYAKRYRIEDQSRAKNLLEEIIEKQTEIGFKHSMFALSDLSAAQISQTNYLEALKTAQKALENQQWSAVPELTSCFTRRIGIAYSVLGKTEEALSWFRAGLKERKNENELIWFNSVLQATTMLYDLNRYTEALRLFDTVMREKPQLTLTQKFMLTDIRGDCYAALNKLDLADKYYIELLTYGKTEAGKRVLKLSSTALAPIAEYYINRGDPVKANLFFRNMLKPEDGTNAFALFDHYNIQYKLDSLKGDYHSAFQHYQAFIKYKNEYDQIEQRKQLDELNLKFATEKKDQNIKLLTAQNKAQQASLKQNQFIRNLVIGGSLLLALILFLVANQYHQKKRSNIIVQRKNEALQRLVHEKEWLLKEVHHRVKNNLQTVVSLLELQSENLRDEALSAIHDSQNRVYAMSLIHQKLYQTDNVASINMQPYLRELTTHLQAVYNPEQKMAFDLKLAAIELDVSQAIPVGLIVNEAVTNSIKYAFDYRRSYPLISITLRQKEKGNLELIVSDNGNGLPAGFVIEKSSGLGFKLIKGLVDDIEGKLTIETDQGILIKVVFNASVPFVEKVAISKLEKAFAL